MADPERPARSQRCPICSEPTDARYRPFCSRRCADIDLGRWLQGSYAIPGDDQDNAPNDAGMSETERHRPDD